MKCNWKHRGKSKQTGVSEANELYYCCLLERQHKEEEGMGEITSDQRH